MCLGASLSSRAFLSCFACRRRLRASAVYRALPSQAARRDTAANGLPPEPCLVGLLLCRCDLRAFTVSCLALSSCFWRPLALFPVPTRATFRTAAATSVYRLRSSSPRCFACYCSYERLPSQVSLPEMLSVPLQIRAPTVSNFPSRDALRAAVACESTGYLPARNCGSRSSHVYLVEGPGPPRGSIHEGRSNFPRPGKWAHARTSINS